MDKNKAAGKSIFKWSPSALDHYLHYLVNLSAISPVFTTRDILTAEGEFLLTANSLLDERACKKLENKLLANSLPSSVQLTSPLAASGLLQYLLNTIRSTEYFQSLAERKHPLSSLEPVCAELDKFPLVQQFLTVMSSQMNDLFQRTLCVGLWGLYIAQEMRLPASEAAEIFWAGMTHDIGMLFIDPKILHKTEKLTAEDWQHIQSHVEISRCVLADIPGFPGVIVTAVAEHHERCDGTGYPLAKVESELSLAGQILAVADAIVGIYFNRFKAQGRRWREVIPVLEMNRAAYLYRSCEIVSTMIHRSELPLPNVVHGSGVPEFAERMLQQNLHLQNWFTQLRDCLTAVGYTHGDRKLHALQNIIFHIATTFKGTMLFKADLRESLASMAGDQGAGISKVVADASLVQQEMLFHLQRLSRMVQMYIASGEAKDPAILARVEEGFMNISGYLELPDQPLN